MLSGMKPDEIIKAIVQGNVKQLESIKGIGKKTAERLILELKEKLSRINTTNLDAFMPQDNTIEIDALNALISLGIGRPLAEAALKKALKNAPSDAPLEEIIRISLKNM